MTNTHSIALHKIIVLIVFICAALMASLFIYHSSQKSNAEPLLSPDVGLLFPVPRDIKSFELVTANNQKFTEKNFTQHWTLLFFGFTHCANICPATLGVMDRVYSELHDKYPDLQVVLVSVDPERDTLDVITKYTHDFNPAFIGATGKVQDIRKVQSQLGVYAARDHSSSAENYQIQHTSSIMLINPQGKWAGLFQFGLKPNVLANAIETSIKNWKHHA